jgi:transcriptional regulator with XRE-family HTH domain
MTMSVEAIALAARVGARLRELREDAELTQREIADRMRSHRPIISRLERGDHLQTVGEVARYAAALELDLATVLVCLDDAWHQAAKREFARVDVAQPAADATPAEVAA